MFVQILIGIISGLISGVIVSLISKFLIERTIQEHDDYKRQVLSILKFFYLLESKTCKPSNESIDRMLIHCRVLFKNDKELMSAFESVDIALSNVLRLNGNGGNVSYNFSCEEFLNFIKILEERI